MATAAKPSDSASTLKICMINVISKRDLSLYELWAFENKVDVIIFTEMSKDFTLSNKVKVHHKLADTRGVAIAILNDKLDFECKFASPHHVVIKIKGNTLLLHGWYVPPEGSQPVFTQQVVESLEHNLMRKGKKEIHMGDFNAHAHELGETPDRRGKRLTTAANIGNYVLINHAGVKTFARKNKESTSETSIDWTMVSSDLVDKTCWSCELPEVGSDHGYTVVEVHKNKIEKLFKVNKKVSPAAFIRNILELTKGHELEEWHHHFTQAVEAANREASNNNKIDLPEPLIALQREIRQLSSLCKKAGDVFPDAKEQFKKLVKRFREEFAKFKAKEEARKIASADKTALYKDLKVDTSKTSKLEFLQHGDAQLRGNDACELLLKKFFPDVKSSNWTIPVDLADDDSPFTQDELTSTLAHFRAHSAPGKSGVNFRPIRSWYARDKTYFLKLFNKWYEEATFPEELKESVVIPLIKNKFGEPSVDNVRPVALTECIGRWYEKLVDNRLMYYLENNNLISDDQYGYRSKKSTVSALQRLQEIREENQRKFEMIVQTDVKSAFDGIDQGAILRTLYENKVPGNLLRIIASFLDHRRAVMNLGEDWVEREVLRGVPQGSCLGPHLYILTTNLMLKELRRAVNSSTSTRCQVMSYADDVILVAASKKPEWATKKAHQLVDKMKCELSKVGLSLSENKTKIMVSSLNIEKQMLTWQGKRTEADSTLEFLGLTLSKDGTFENHVEKIIAKADNWLAHHVKLLAPGTPLNYDLRKTLINTVLAPKLTYAASVWYPKCNQGTKLKLQYVSKKAAAAITAASPLASKTAVTLLAKSLPMHLQCETEAQLGLVRHSQKYFDTPIRKMISWKTLVHPSKWRNLELGATITKQEEIDALGAEICIYTDGSKFQDEESNEARTGAAVVWYEGFNQTEPTSIQLYKLSENNSVYQCEALAIKRALIELLTKEFDGMAFILSDSLSALTAIASATPSETEAVECKMILDQLLAQGKHVELRHIKAHIGLAGNERADEEAKKATISGEKVTLEPSYSWARNAIKRKAYQAFDDEFKRSKTGTEVKNFFDGPLDPQLKLARISRNTTELYAGTGLNHQSIRMGFQREGFCPCGSKQSMKHLAIDCPRLMETNIQTAQRVGITVQEFLSPWEDLKRHKRIHEGIALI